MRRGGEIGGLPEKVIAHDEARGRPEKTHALWKRQFTAGEGTASTTAFTKGEPCPPWQQPWSAVCKSVVGK
jgi:hypothetical protein